MPKVKRLRDIAEMIRFTRLFNRAIGYSNVPWQYYASGKMYALYDDKNRITGGFVLVPGYFNTRTIQQIPEARIKEYYTGNTKIAEKMCDLTGYFILNPRGGFLLTLYLTWICLWYHKKYFAYTYPVDDFALEKYYGQGKPKRIHTGEPVHLDGHADVMHPEHVEYLTKWGIIRIFIYRNIRLLKSNLLKVLHINRT